jgi:hypothetical protein
MPEPMKTATISKFKVRKGMFSKNLKIKLNIIRSLQ